MLAGWIAKDNTAEAHESSMHTYTFMGGDGFTTAFDMVYCGLLLVRRLKRVKKCAFKTSPILCRWQKLSMVPCIGHRSPCPRLLHAALQQTLYLAE
jgi:hypothetical protein